MCIKSTKLYHVFEEKERGLREKEAERIDFLQTEHFFLTFFGEITIMKALVGAISNGL